MCHTGFCKKLAKCPQKVRKMSAKITTAYKYNFVKLN